MSAHTHASGLLAQGYLVQLEDRAFHQGHLRRVLAKEVAGAGAEARRIATAWRESYQGSRYSVSFEDDANGEAAGGGKRWISLATQRLNPELRRLLSGSDSMRQRIELPCMNNLVTARRFFWPLVHAKSRKQRKRMSERLTQILVGPAGERLRQAWGETASMLDLDHPAYRDRAYFDRGTSSIHVVDEQADFIHSKSVPRPALF